MPSYTYNMAIVSWPYIPWRQFTLCRPIAKARGVFRDLEYIGAGASTALRPYHYNELLISSRNHNRPRHYSTALPQQRPVDSALVKTLPLVAVLLTFLCSSIGFFYPRTVYDYVSVCVGLYLFVLLRCSIEPAERIELVLARKFSSANPTLCFQEIRPK